MNTINVVMLIRDRLALTKQSIESFIHHTTVPANLTLVDDCSGPETEEYLSTLAKGSSLSLQVVRNELALGVGGSRNRGIRESESRFGKGDWLYLSDNDVYFERGWAEVLLSAAAHHPEALIIGGGCHPFMQPHAVRHPKFDAWLGMRLRLGPYELVYRDAISGYSWLLRWQTWREFGPFPDNGRGTGQSEDWAVSRRVVESGYYVGSVAPEVVHHTGATATGGEPIVGAELACAGAREKGVLVL